MVSSLPFDFSAFQLHANGVDGLVIRRVEPDAFDTGIWEIFERVVARGDTYAYDPSTTKEQVRTLWMALAYATYVALLAGPDRRHLHPAPEPAGARLARGQLRIHGAPVARRRGSASAMCRHSLDEAPKAGDTAMQFTSVVRNNARATCRREMPTTDCRRRIHPMLMSGRWSRVEVFWTYRRNFSPKRQNWTCRAWRLSNVNLVPSTI